MRCCRSRPGTGGGAGRRARRRRPGRHPRPSEPGARGRELPCGVRGGARQIDGTLCAPGAGAGNSPTEILVPVLKQMGVPTGVDTQKVLAAAEEVARPFIPRLPCTDRAAITQGYPGVCSSFLLHAERAGERYGVPAHEILRRWARRGTSAVRRT
ncbi:hypothetical protein [Streptomyces atratus]